MIKIKFFSDYADSSTLLERFKANYDVYDDQLKFTIGEDYNVAVAFNRSNEVIKQGVKVITVIQEPSFSEAHRYRAFLAYSDYLIIHDPDLFERVWNVKLLGKVIESPSFMFYHDEVNHSFFGESEHLQKTRKLSIIISSMALRRGNYSKRLGVLSKILDSDLDIDIFGRGFNITDPRYKGEVQYKHTALLPYEYSIAIENSNEKNYISEKFVDCILCNTVPIYNGAPNVAEVYDHNYFETIDLDSPTIIDDIKEIVAHPARGTKKNKDIYLNDLNLYSKLKEIVAEISRNNGMQD